MTAILLALTIAFPRAGQQLPYVERCYLIGAVEPGETNLLVQGRSVPVYRTGAWATMVPCTEGTNVVSVAGSNHWFRVARKPKRPAPSAATNRAPAKVWKKLAYADETPHPRPATNETATVYVDAGHGGSDTGAVSPHNLPEKDANLRMAKAVCRELTARGVRVALTRDGDTALPLYDRPKAAHREDAAAFISIHHNAPPYDRDPNEFRYTAVYAWNEIGTELATAINRRMSAALPALRNNGVPHANFAVTRSPEIPSCLIEVDFITHPAGEEDSWDPVRRATVAAAIADGVMDWLGRPQ